MFYRILAYQLVPILLLIDSPSYGQDQQAETMHLAQAIEADIRDAVRLAGAKIEVRATEGQVTLSGTTNSIFDKNMAARIAKRTRGVTAVLNQVVVQRSDRSDEAIRADVRYHPPHGASRTYVP